jgi:monoamine oxidase
MIVSRRQLLGTGAGALASLALPARATGRTDVVIAGAGLAGLASARLLKSEGFSVVVLEGAQRVGGRLKTLDRLPGAPEAGGQTIDAMYARVLRAIEDLGLATIPRAPPVPGDAILIGGAAIDASRWSTSPLNRGKGAARSISPGRLYAHFLDEANPIAELTDWTLPRHAGLDAIGVSSLLRRAGADRESLRLMQLWFDGPRLDQMSALFACRKRLVERFGAQAAYRVAGGSQRLPEAMAASLGDAVRLGDPVVAVRQEAGAVTMVTASGKQHQARAGLIALPFPAVRRLALDPVLPASLAAAVQGLPYSEIIMVTLKVNRPFWEEDGLPPGMYVDGFVQRVTAAGGQGGGVPTLACWLRGKSAKWAATRPDDAVAARVLAELALQRPATNGALSAGDVTRWNAGSSGGGAYHYFAPGQTGKLFAAMRQPWGRVRFAGEHLADLQQGMEGAMESAERETLELMGAL